MKQLFHLNLDKLQSQSLLHLNPGTHKRLFLYLSIDLTNPPNTKVSNADPKKFEECAECLRVIINRQTTASYQP